MGQHILYLTSPIVTVLCLLFRQKNNVFIIAIDEDHSIQIVKKIYSHENEHKDYLYGVNGK